MNVKVEADEALVNAERLMRIDKLTSQQEVALTKTFVNAGFDRRQN